MNNIAKNSNFISNGARKTKMMVNAMMFSASFVIISKIFAMQDAFFAGAEPVGGV